MTVLVASSRLLLHRRPGKIVQRKSAPGLLDVRLCARFELRPLECCLTCPGLSSYGESDHMGVQRELYQYLRQYATQKGGGVVICTFQKRPGRWS